VFFLLAAAVVFLQFTVLGDINILAALVILAGLKKGIRQGLTAGCIIGSLVGIFSTYSFVFNVALYVILGLAAGSARSRMFYKETLFSEFLFCFAGIILFHGLIFMLKGAPQPFIFYTAFFSAVVSPLAFRAVEM